MPSLRVSKSTPLGPGSLLEWSSSSSFDTGSEFGCGGLRDSRSCGKGEQKRRLSASSVYDHIEGPPEVLYTSRRLWKMSIAGVTRPK